MRPVFSENELLPLSALVDIVFCERRAALHQLERIWENNVATVVFCNRFIDRRSRTHDQMVQAARSGKQNIAEGSMASGTSKKTELKLAGVARASLEELLPDAVSCHRLRPCGSAFCQ